MIFIEILCLISLLNHNIFNNLTVGIIAVLYKKVFKSKLKKVMLFYRKTQIRLQEFGKLHRARNRSISSQCPMSDVRSHHSRPWTVVKCHLHLATPTSL